MNALTHTDSFHSHFPFFSPDGTRIVMHLMVDEAAGKFQTVIVSAETGEILEKLDLDKDTMWHPDGRSLLYVDSKDGVDNIWSFPLGDGKPRQITNFTSDLIFSWSISHDGKRLAISRGSVRQDAILITDFR